MYSNLKFFPILRRILRIITVNVRNSSCTVTLSLFPILRRILRIITVNVRKSSCKIPFILVRFYWKLYFPDKNF